MRKLSRRDFLKLMAGAAGAVALQPYTRALGLDAFPTESPIIARNCTGGKINLKAAPNNDSETLEVLYEDALLPWLREVTGPMPYRMNQRWVETPRGYVYASDVQPSRNLPNTPLTSMPEGQRGFFAEVTVPYANLVLANPPARAPWLQDTLTFGLIPRLYYGQVVWIDEIRTGDDGVTYYRFNEDIDRGWGIGDLFWVEGAALRPLTPEDVAPIHPDVDPAEKKVVVNLNYQSLSCYEGNREVFFCRVSTGREYNASGQPVENPLTPVGSHLTWRKAITIHMQGGTTGNGWDTPAVAWTTLFAGTGIAIHAAFWHNDFGAPRSQGCVNATAEDAKWIFRWTTPHVSLDQGDMTMSLPNHGTVVAVERRII